MCLKSSSLAAAGLFALTLLSSSDASAQQHAAIWNALQDVSAKLDAIVVPFKVEDTTGGLCDSAGPGTSTPEIIIDSDGVEGEFVVTSILLKSASPGVPVTGFDSFHINSVDIDGERFDTRTGALLGFTDGTGVLESVDIMGTPGRRNSDTADPVAGGNFPYQIVAQSDDIDDIHVHFFCSTNDDDFNFDRVLVAGWKRPGDTITVTFVPGT